MQRIYLDYNASTPIDPAVATAMRPFLEGHYGNPSSGHWATTTAKTALETARGQVTALLGCQNDEVVFTSGGSEANNLALKGVFFALREKGDHIITTRIEHPAIHRTVPVSRTPWRAGTVRSASTPGEFSTAKSLQTCRSSSPRKPN
jgi:cysteine desulfurase